MFKGKRRATSGSCGRICMFMYAPTTNNREWDLYGDGMRIGELSMTMGVCVFVSLNAGANSMNWNNVCADI